MSSVVKKSSHFVPKLKRNAVRKRNLPTPPSTQTENVPSSQPEDESVPATPLTQEEGVTPLISYTIDNNAPLSPKEKPSLDMDVDPKDSSNVLEQVIEENDTDNEYGDNDIFRQPVAGSRSRRRSSVTSHRRLSGIAAFRKASISATPTASAPPDGDKAQNVPVTIGIPLAKPTKKRRASSVVKASKRISKGSVILVPAVIREPEDRDAGTSKKDQPPASRPEADIIVGIDPTSGKFKKYRTSESVEGYADLPAAPDGLITTLTSIKQLPRKISKEDEKYFAMVDILTDDLTMAELCKPTIQIGSVSDKFTMAEDAKKKIALKRDVRRQARKQARERKISYESALRELQGDNYEDDTPKKAVSILNMPDVDEPKTTRSVQVSIVEGKMVVNPESTVVTRDAVVGAGDRQVEIENPFENPITSNSYTKLAHTDAWDVDELMKLYNALSTWGTDFTFIAQLFPHRTRRQVKRKFILEEKRNPELVELALRRRLPPDFEAYCQNAAASAKFKSLEEFHSEMEDLKKDHEKHLEEINSERERAIKEDLEASRKREIEIRTGAKSMTRAEKVKELRRNETVVGTIEDVKKSREELEKLAKVVA